MAILKKANALLNRSPAIAYAVGEEQPITDILDAYMTTTSNGTGSIGLDAIATMRRSRKRCNSRRADWTG